MKNLPDVPGYVFRFYCQKVLPAVFDDSLSYYEVLCKLQAKINEIISLDMSQNDAIKELQNYFSSLDIEQAVLDGLNAMATAGTLTDILTAYITLAKSFAFTTKAALKAAQNLTPGTICQTLGDENYQTGDGSFWYVRAKTNDDVIDDDNIVGFTHTYDPVIIAEKIPDPLATSVASLADDLTTTDGNLDALTNKYDQEIGDLDNLKTATKTEIVGAINSEYDARTQDVGSINDSLTTLSNNVGDKSDLQTSSTTSIVSAINSLYNTTWDIEKGGTGADTAGEARENLGLYSQRKVFDRHTNLNNNWTITDVNLPYIDYLQIFYAYNPENTETFLDKSIMIKFKSAGVITNLDYIYPYASGGNRLIDIASTGYTISYNSSTNNGTLTLETGTRFVSTITNSTISTAQTTYNQMNVYRVIAYQYH